jgi:hypothetical protein
MATEHAIRRELLHDDDVVLRFTTPESAHEAVLLANAHAKALVRAPDNAGRVFRIIVGEERDSLSARQRRFMHGPLLGQIAEQVRVNGERFVIAVWKRYYKDLFLGHTWEMVKMPGQKKATPRKKPVSSEDLSVKQYSEWIDKVLAHAATEFGVRFVFQIDEREAVRYRPPPRRARAEAAPAEAATEEPA